MKLGFNWRGAKATPVPKRTFAELAEEFGLSRYGLTQRMRRSTQNPPKPTLKCRGSMTTNDVTWYDPAEMRAWWKREQSTTKHKGTA